MLDQLILDQLIFIGFTACGIGLVMVLSRHQSRSPSLTTKQKTPIAARENLAFSQQDLLEPEPVKPEPQTQSVEQPSIILSKNGTLHSDELSPSRCPCGLVLSEESMIEHVQNTGHSGLVASSPVKLGKIWDLQEATIERASPACYKCGKPVQGLKRIGKTIYVSHFGCRDKGSKEDKMEGLAKDQGPGVVLAGLQTLRKTRKAYRCPICWKPVTNRKVFARVVSSRGEIMKFHKYCLELESKGSSLDRLDIS